MEEKNLKLVQSFLAEVIRPIIEEAVTHSIENVKKLNYTLNEPEVLKSEGFITESEAQKLLGGISKVTMWKGRKRGLFIGYRIGKSVRYRASEVLEAVSKIRTIK